QQRGAGDDRGEHEDDWEQSPEPHSTGLDHGEDRSRTAVHSEDREGQADDPEDLQQPMALGDTTHHPPVDEERDDELGNEQRDVHDVEAHLPRQRAGTVEVVESRDGTVPPAKVEYDEDESDAHGNDRARQRRTAD